MADDKELLAWLRAEAEGLGIKVDGRWGVERLRDEIEAAKADRSADESADESAEPVEEPEDAGEPEDELEPAAQDEKPEPHRAGGHVDYRDGRGWMPDLEPEPVAPAEPVKAGVGGLPGHPVMAAAGWTPTDEGEK